MVDDINEIVRQNIITFMNQKNISTTDIIKKKDGVCNDSIYKYLSGTRKISLKLCKFFAETINVKVKDLFDEETYYKFKDKYKKPYKKYNNTIIDNERDITIYFYRKLSENKKTLQQLGDEFNISRERVRQIENQYEQKYIIGEKNG